MTDVTMRGTSNFSLAISTCSTTLADQPLHVTHQLCLVPGSQVNTGWRKSSDESSRCRLHIINCALNKESDFKMKIIVTT